MIDIDELRMLAQAVSGWSNCNQAWLDQSEDVPAAVVGHIDEDGNAYPIATIDCDQYYAAHQSLPLAKFYAAANPTTISELLDRLEAAEKERDVLRDRLALESQENGALRDSVDRACEERDAPRVENAGLVDDMNLLRNNNTSLRAKIAEMEQQEPVGEIQRANSTGNYICSEVWVPLPVGSKLYALPGAQPAPNVPGGWKLVPIVSTDEMDNAGSEHCDGYLSTAQAVWDAMIAAAPKPEAKP